MRSLLSFALALALLPTFAYAHGGMDHVMGTIASITPGSITVTTTDGGSQTVLLTPETKYERNQTAITAKEIKVGERVVIHATRKNNALTAATVEVGGGSKPAAMGNQAARPVK